MAGFALAGDTSGQLVVNAPAVAGSNTLTLQAATATNSVNTLGTAVASTSGTSIDFTSLPSWIKRITVVWSGVSTNGNSNFLVQIGAGSVQTTGYQSGDALTTSLVSSTAGMIMFGNGTLAYSGMFTFVTVGSNTWVSTHSFSRTSDGGSFNGGGTVTLSGTLDRLRVTTVNGTDTFDAGTINILYEG